MSNKPFSLDTLLVVITSSLLLLSYTANEKAQKKRFLKQPIIINCTKCCLLRPLISKIGLDLSIYIWKTEANGGHIGGTT